MSIFNDKALKGVAEAVSKIVEAEKMAKKDHDQDGKIESGKAEYLGSRIRAAKMAGKLKEDEQLEEGGMPSSVIKHKQSLATKTPEQLHAGFKEVAKRMGKSVEDTARSTAWSHGYGKGAGKGSSHYWDKVKHLEPKSESVEQLQEYESKGGVFKHKAKLAMGAKYGESDYSKGGEEDTESKKDLDYQKTSKKTGARQNNFNRGKTTGYTSKAKTVKEETKLSFTEMLQLYNEAGLEVIAKIVPEKVNFGDIEVEVFDADKINGTIETDIVEEVDNETFTKEVEAQKEKNAGRGKKAEVAKASVQAVKQEEVEQIDELSKDTLSMYVKKAHYSGGMADFKHGRIADKRGDSKDKMKLSKISRNRERGINKAVDRLTKKD